MRFSHLLALALMGISPMWAAPALHGQTRDEKVRQDRSELLADDAWYYDDLEAGLAAAKEQNKPLMAVLRCIP